MKQDFGVCSKYASVYNAFIIECEKIGWIWNSSFNGKTRVNEYLNEDSNYSGSCIYLSDTFGACLGKPAMSFSSDSNLMCLDTNFDAAIEKAREYYECMFPKKQPLTMKLSSDYDAVIDKNEIVVGCQHISFKVFDELALLVKQYRES